MPALSQIVTIINNSFVTGQFSTRKYQIAKYFGITDPVKTTMEDMDKIEPMIIDDNGECIKVVYDDTQAFQIFHKLDTIDYKIADPDYGFPGTTMEEAANMKLIFFGNRKRLQTRAEDLIAAVALDMPKEFSTAQIQTLGLNSCVIEIGDVESDPYKVFSEEWSGIDTFVKPETILFSIRYKIIDTYNKNCFLLCGPENQDTYYNV